MSKTIDYDVNFIDNITISTMVVSSISAASLNIGSVTYPQNISATNFTVSSITANNLITTNISNGDLRINNVYADIFVTSSNMAATNMTTGDLRVNTRVSSANISNLNASIGNIVMTNLAGTNVSTGDLRVNNVYTATLITSSNTVTTNMTAGDLRVNTRVSSANISSLNATIGNIVNTNLVSTNMSTSNLRVNNVYAATLITSSNIAVTNISTTNLIAANNIVTTTGNIGIGTTTPISSLSIVKSSSVGSMENSQNGLQIYSTNGLASTSLYIGADKDGDVAYIQASKSGSFLPLVLNNRGGNVGIGTSSPNDTLDVAGNLRVNELITSSNLLTTDITTGTIRNTDIISSNTTVNNVRIINNGNLGLNVDLPEAFMHTRDTVNRMDAVVEPRVMMTNMASNYSSVYKTFVFGVEGTAACTGNFYINDWGNQVGGGGQVRRLTINSRGNIGIGGVFTGINNTIHVSNSSLVTTFITTPNFITTAITTVNLVATGNSNTIGSIITTGGNICIGNTPNTKYRLEVVGSAVSDNGTGSGQSNDGIRVSHLSSLSNTIVEYQNNEGITWDTGTASTASGWGQFRRAFYAWNQSSGALLVGKSTGNWGINESFPGNTLHVNSSSLVTTFITTPNLITTNTTITNIVSTNITTGDLRINTRISSANISSLNSSIGNIRNTNILTTNVTTGDLRATNIYAATFVTSSNIAAASMTTGNLLVNTSITSNNMIITNSATIGSLKFDNLNFNNLTATSITSSNIIIPNNATVGNIVNTNISAGNLRATNVYAATLVTSTNMASANVSTGDLRSTDAYASSSVLIGTTNSPDGTRFISALDSGMGGTNVNKYFTFGQGASTFNQADLQFNYVGSGNNTNSQHFTFFGVAPLLSIRANGNVGIGASAPDTKLDIRGNGPQEFNLQNVGANGGRFKLWANNDTKTYLQASGDMHFGDINLSPSNVPRIYLTTSGNVGIGTTVPGQKLDIRGNMYIGNNTQSNFMAFYGLNGDGAENWNHSYIGERIFGALDQSELIIVKGNDFNSPVGPDRIRLLSQEIRFDINSAGISGTFDECATSANNINRMIINTAGNVGIGTLTPALKLDVTGNINDNLMQLNNINAGGYATIVFKNNLGVIGSVGLSGVDSIVYLGFGGAGSAISGMTNGNWGINQPNPNYNLDISGTNGCLINTTINTQSNILLTNNIQGGVINFFDGHHSIWGRRSVNGVLDKMQFREYGDIEFWTGGALADQKRRVLVKSDGAFGVNTDNFLGGWARIAPPISQPNDTTGDQLVMTVTSTTDEICRFYGATIPIAQIIFGDKSAMRVGRSTTTSRSIGLSGTFNGSGSDYAEYMYKNDQCGVISKGDICGVDSLSKLTDKYDEAITFVVKSTNPSYVGGDTCGSENDIGKRPELTKFTDTETFTAEQQYNDALKIWEENLEQRRQKVDRIAFCGQVPVNIYTASVGDYIIPIRKEDGSIGGIGISKNNVTFEQYRIAIGTVINILEDGRANIIVKIV